MIYKKSKILWNKRVGDLYYKMGIGCDVEFFNAVPGQFIMLRLADHTVSLLNRPFSLHNLIYKNKKPIGIELLYKVVGRCTKAMSQQKEGDFVHILGPLGNGFMLPDKGSKIFIVAGGIGAAPMIFLLSSIKQKYLLLSDTKFFLGGKTKDDILCVDEIAGLKVALNITTDDGSLGEKGFITESLKKEIKKNRPDIIYACGPFNMLKAVAGISRDDNISCHISIETIMACGMGACLGCAVETAGTSGKYAHVCIDGPVFDASLLKI